MFVYVCIWVCCLCLRMCVCRDVHMCVVCLCDDVSLSGVRVCVWSMLLCGVLGGRRREGQCLGKSPAPGRVFLLHTERKSEGTTLRSFRFQHLACPRLQSPLAQEQADSWIPLIPQAATWAAAASRGPTVGDL